MQLLKTIPWLIVFLVAIVGLFIFFSDYIGIVLPISFTDRTNIFLSFAIALFAALEGYSTFMQVELSQKTNIIEDAKNELEKAYGPLYTLLNNINLKFDQEGFWLTIEEKNKLDNIMATYPFMFPSEINNLWRKNPVALAAAQQFQFSMELRNKINQEYKRRVKRYNELLKK